MKRFICCFMIVLIVVLGCGCDVEDLLKRDNSSDPPNVGNILTSAAGFVVQPLDTVNFWIEADDPTGGSLTYQWRINAGEIIGSSSTNELRWRAPIKGGNYTLSVDVSNKAETVTRSEVVKVPSVTEPKVEILAPLNMAFLVQHTNVIVKATARHENNIQEVQMWLDEQYLPLTPELDGDIYLFDWKIQANPGAHVLVIKAIAQLTGVVGSDSVTLYIEGIVAGKN